MDSGEVNYDAEVVWDIFKLAIQADLSCSLHEQENYKPSQPPLKPGGGTCK